MLGLSACQGASPPHAHGGPTPTAAGPATADPQRCARLAKRGFTPCPPTADRLHLPPTTIRNATNGAIPDATAQTWGRAFQLTEAYYRWAVEANSRAALTSGTLGDERASANLFGPDLLDLDKAAQQGGRLVDQPPRLASVRLVPVPADLQQQMTAQGLTARPYGFAVELQGPAAHKVRLTDGQEVSLWSVDSSQVQSLLIWGEARTDPDLGAIWFEGGLYGCDGAVRHVCQA